MLQLFLLVLQFTHTTNVLPNNKATTELSLGREDARVDQP
jgi:hypothetical protein